MMRTITQHTAFAAAGAAALMTMSAAAPAHSLAAHATPTAVTAVASAPKVSIRVSTGTATKNQRFTVSGAASPHAQVTIQASTGGTWRNVARTVATSKGAFSASVAHVGGNALYRAVAKAAGGSGISAVRKVSAPTTARAYKLSDYYTKTSASRKTSGTINSVAYDFMVGINKGWSASWDLQGCTQLTAKLGVDDTYSMHREGTLFSGSVAVDGENVVTKTMKRLDDAVPVQISLKGARRLTFSHAIKQSGSYGRFNFANATVTCTTEPQETR